MRPNSEERDQILGITKTRLCKVFKNQQLTKSCRAPGGSKGIGDYRGLF